MIFTALLAHVNGTYDDQTEDHEGEDDYWHFTLLQIIRSKINMG